VRRHLLVLLASWCLVAPASAFDEMNRPNFSLQPAGQLAYAGTSESDWYNNRLKVMRSCESLKNGVHQILINHRMPNSVGKIGYFLIEIFLGKDGNPDQTSEPQIDFIEVYRSGKPRSEDWFDRKGEFGPSTLGDTAAIGIFFSSHADPDGSSKIPRKYANWHGKSSSDAESSFSLSREEIHPRTNAAGQQAYKYRLIRTVATNQEGSTNIPPFSFNSGDYDFAIIRVSSPEFNLEQGATYRMRFNGPCPQ
jgi:hypothetical protein